MNKKLVVMIRVRMEVEKNIKKCFFFREDMLH